MAYDHWGTFISPTVSNKEPNEPLALCAIANASQEYEGAWGWADTSCASTYPVMCKCVAHFLGTIGLVVGSH
jgi:hypothetical protein